MRTFGDSSRRSNARLGPCASRLVAFAVREPAEYGRTREPPFLPEASAWQVAALRAGPHRVRRDPEQRRNVFEREHIFGDCGHVLVAHVSSVGDLHSPDGKRASSWRQPVFEEFTDQVLFRTAGRVREAVERGCLIARQPDEQRSSIVRHAGMISIDIKRYQAALRWHAYRSLNCD